MTIKITVALKYVPLRTSVDHLNGRLDQDDRLHGSSPADAAALEWALRLQDLWGAEVSVVCVGPPEAEAMLRDALAAGAVNAIRVDGSRTLDSVEVGHILARVAIGSDFVLCGDYSLDRGTGSVPAYIAHFGQWAQALGLVDLSVDPDNHGVLEAQRRLDQGRREVLRLQPGSVLSVEGGIRLRRASPRAMIAAQTAPIEVQQLPPHPASQSSPEHSLPILEQVPFRPRTRVISAPSGSTNERLRQLSGASSQVSPAQSVELTPAAAAELVEQRLRQWGYLENPPGAGDPSGE